MCLVIAEVYFLEASQLDKYDEQPVKRSCER